MFSSNLQRTVNYIMAIIIVVGNLVILNYLRKLDKVDDCVISAEELDFMKKYLYGMIFLNITVFVLQMFKIA